MLAHRPDLAAALYRAHAASRLVKVAKTQFYPTIDLTGFVGFNALTLTKGADKLANFLFRGQSLAYGSLRVSVFRGSKVAGSEENWALNARNMMGPSNFTMTPCWMRCGKWRTA